MSLPIIPPKAIVRGPFLPEPVEVILTVPMGDSLKLIGRGLNTGMSYDPVLSPTQLTGLEISPEREPLDGNPDRFRLGIEAARLALAYEYDPFFSLSVARIDPLPHQLEAVYEYFVKLPRIRGLTYRFVTLVPFKFFGHRRIWIEGQDVIITDRAKTLVDCLDHPEHCGGIVEAAKGLYEGLTRGKVSPSLLTEVAERMQNRAILKRLGYLSELLDLPVGAEIGHWQDALSTGYTRLDPLAGDHGPYDSRWQLRLNRTPADLTDWLVH